MAYECIHREKSTEIDGNKREIDQKIKARLISKNQQSQMKKKLWKNSNLDHMSCSDTMFELIAPIREKERRK